MQLGEIFPTKRQFIEQQFLLPFDNFSSQKDFRIEDNSSL